MLKTKGFGCSSVWRDTFPVIAPVPDYHFVNLRERIKCSYSGKGGANKVESLSGDNFALEGRIHKIITFYCKLQLHHY